MVSWVRAKLDTSWNSKHGFTVETTCYATGESIWISSALGSKPEWVVLVSTTPSSCEPSRWQKWAQDVRQRPESTGVRWWAWGFLEISSSRHMGDVANKLGCWVIVNERKFCVAINKFEPKSRVTLGWAWSTWRAPRTDCHYPASASYRACRCLMVEICASAEHVCTIYLEYRASNGLVIQACFRTLFVSAWDLHCNKDITAISMLHFTAITLAGFKVIISKFHDDLPSINVIPDQWSNGNALQRDVTSRNTATHLAEL